MTAKRVIPVVAIIWLVACLASAAFGSDSGHEYTKFGKYQPVVMSRCDKHGNRIYMTSVGIGGANIPYGGDIFVLSPDQHSDCP